MLKAALYSLGVLSTLIAILLCFAIDDSPSPVKYQSLDHDDIQRAKQLLHVAPDERNTLKTVSLNPKDLNIAASYLLGHFVKNTTSIDIQQDKLRVQIAIFVPESLWGKYLDLHFALRQVDDTIRIKSFKIGEISIPDPAANVLIPAIVEYSPLNKYWLVAKQYVKNVRVTPQALEVSYLGSIVDAAKQLVIQKHQKYPHLHEYQQQINAIVSAHDPNWRLSISELLQPLFLSAYQNTKEEDAIQENRAVIIAVGSYIYKNDLYRFLPLGLVYSKELPVFAYKRTDIPQHFIASALLAAVDASLFAEQIGVDKELGDAAKGSGFSFIDLAADKAGTQFGKAAIATREKAREFQKRMAAIKDYNALIPQIDGLPEHMDEAEFQARFQAVGSPAYKQMVEEIDRRISNLPLYQAITPE